MRDLLGRVLTGCVVVLSSDTYEEWLTALIAFWKTEIGPS